VSDKDSPSPGYTRSERITYRKEINRLNGKWPHAEADVDSSLTEKPLDVEPGDAIPNLGEQAGKVFKRQILSSDIKDGKSGGFRLIYLVSEDRKSVALMSIYCKSEKVNISAKEILKLIKQTEECVPPGIVEIKTTPAEAEVWIDAEFIAWSPCTVTVSAGSHNLMCRIQPYLIAERDFICNGGETVKLEINLK
jgi:hypothetical protein